MTSAMPMPVREMATAARRPSATASSARPGAATLGPASARTAPGTAAADALRSRPTVSAGSPIDWRQISAPPAAIRKRGQTIASENHSPSSRSVSSTATSSRPVPSATSTAARPVRIRTRDGRESPAGIRSQPSAYAANPAPPAAAATTNASRTSVTSTPNRRATPAATPPIQPASRSRRSSPADPADAVVMWPASRSWSRVNHRGRPMPDASRIAPTAAQHAGASTPKRRSAVPVPSSRSSRPSATMHTPATTDVMSGLANTAGVAPEVVVDGPEVEVAVVHVDVAAGVADPERADAQVGLHQDPGHPRPRIGQILEAHVDSIVVPLERAELADSHVRVGGDADIPRDDHARLAHAQVELDRSVAGGQVGGPQVDDQLAHAERVLVAQVECGGRAVVALAHAPVEVDAGGRHRPGGQGECHGGENEPADGPQEAAGQDRHAGDDHHDRHHGLASGGGRPRAADRDQSADGEDRDAEERALGDGARLARRSLAGDEPPDQNTRGDQKGERNSDGFNEKTATEKKGPADAQQHDHAGDHEPAVASWRGVAGPVLGGDQEQRGEVGEQSGAAREREHDGADPEDDRVHVEVAAEPGADAADHPALAHAHQAARLRGQLLSRLVHGMRVPP